MEKGCGGREEVVEGNDVGGPYMGWRVAEEEKKDPRPEVADHGVTAAAASWVSTSGRM